MIPPPAAGSAPRGNPGRRRRRYIAPPFGCVPNRTRAGKARTTVRGATDRTRPEPAATTGTVRQASQRFSRGLTVGWLAAGCRDHGISAHRGPGSAEIPRSRPGRHEPPTDPHTAVSSLAAVFTVGYTGFIAGPPIIGILADAIGLPATLALICLAALVVAALAGRALAAGDAAAVKSSQLPGAPQPLGQPPETAL